VAFLCWQDDQHNEVFSLPRNDFLPYTPPPSPARDALFEDRAGSRTAVEQRLGQIRVGRVQRAGGMGSDVGRREELVRERHGPRPGRRRPEGKPRGTERVWLPAEQPAASARGIWSDAGLAGHRRRRSGGPAR